jgi:hypothetical protein
MDPVSSARRRDDACVDDVDGSSTTATLATLPDRALRMLAQANYERLAADGRRGPVDCNKLKDADRCGTETVPNAVLFLPPASEARPVEGSGVTQGALNDCHIMAPLAAIASSPAGLALIRSAVTESRNDKGDVVYSVTLHQPHDHWLGPTTYTDVKFTLDGHFDAKHAVARQDENHQSEVWTLVVEKAFAQYYGGYRKIDVPQSPARQMELLTGRPAVDLPLGTSSGYGAHRLECDLAAGRLVVLLSKPSFDGAGPSGIVANHGYQVANAVLVDGKLMVTLHNPWNDPKRQPQPIAFENLSKWFVSADVGTVR